MLSMSFLLSVYSHDTLNTTDTQTHMTNKYKKNKDDDLEHKLFIKCV